MRRDKTIDIVKAIGLLLMLMGHAGFPHTHFIYLFHMALFFMASGFLFKGNKIDSIQKLVEYIKRKIKALWIPYVGWNILYLALNNTFIKMGIYPSETASIGVKDFFLLALNTLFFKSGTLFTCAFWFVRILFMIEICMAFVSLICNRINNFKKCLNIVYCCIAICAISIGFVLDIKRIDIFNSSMFFAALFIFVVGILFREIKWNQRCNTVWMIIISFCLLLFLDSKGTILLSENRISDPIFFLLCSVLGWTMMIALGNLLSRNDTIASVAYIINISAMDILAMHFVCFKLVSYTQIQIHGLELNRISTFPVLSGENGWWILYTLVGVGVPVLFSMIKRKIRNIFKNRQGV